MDDRDGPRARPRDAALAAAADGESPGRARENLPLLVSLAAAVLVVAVVQPVSSLGLGAHASFMPAMLALVGALDLLSAVLLLRQFRDTGDRRALVLSSAYVFSLAVLAGFGAAFPGVLADAAPLGQWASTAPWLYVVWHTAFPVLVAFAVAPWPRGWTVPSHPDRRRGTALWTVTGSVAAGALCVAAAVFGSGWLPVVIDGMDGRMLSRVTGPVALPLAGVATAVAVSGALRLAGPLRWAALAGTAATGDLVLTLVGSSRFSLGWYTGRTLTVVSSAVVLVAMLSEFGRLKAKLAREGDRLRALLEHTEELEGLHATLLNHMADGVLLQAEDGRVLASNPAAASLLGLSVEQLHGKAPLPLGWEVVRPDGSRWPAKESPAMVALSTGEAQRDAMVGVRLPDGGRRWLRVNSSAEPAGEQRSTGYVVSSMTDETGRQDALLAATRGLDEKRHLVKAILDEGGPSMVVQPIVDLRTGDVVGGEALSRFRRPPVQGPDRWFADAFEVGLGVELELAAVRTALRMLDGVPAPAYLSINVSPATAAAAGLLDLLAAPDVPAARVVLELTEHTGVADYPSLNAALTDLRTLGVRVAVDDAGSGFASLRHILKLGPDIVKLDLDLVRGIHADPARRALAVGLLIFAEQIGACIVAEGIETAEELSALREVGVTHGQGYYLGRPAPLPLLAGGPLHRHGAVSGVATTR